MNDMELFQEWDENTDITWRKEGRQSLNKVIRKYNKWAQKHIEDEVKTTKMLVKINKHLEMYYCNQDGGSCYKDELIRMKRNIQSKLVLLLSSND